MDALIAARRRLKFRISQPQALLVPGLKDDLRAVDEAFEDVERAVATLAAFMLRKHFWPNSPVNKAQLEAVMRMGAESAAVGRVGTHGDRCTCSECMGVG